MNYFIEYTVLCNKGLIRKKNQDNFWCMGEFLEKENNGLITPVVGIANTKSAPAFAIFDGMGGEQQGEVAAYIAADSFDLVYRKNSKSDINQFLINACDEMNGAICRHIKEQHISSSGTTAAIVMFNKADVYICNIGDSRIYQFSDNKLTQLSRDHCDNGIFDMKPSLSQYLGIPETEFIIEPYITRVSFENGDKYLICSDGLTDMVTDDEIGKILAGGSDHTSSAMKLLQKALEAGGNDNITLVLCELHKK